MLSLTMRGLLAHKRRLVSTVVAVVLGVGFMLGSLVLSHTLKSALADVNVAAEQNTDVLVRGAATVDGDYGTLHGDVDASLVSTVAAVDGVAAVAPRIEGYAQILGADGKPIDDLASGDTPLGEAWAGSSALNAFHLVDGSAPNSADEIVIDRRTADRADLAVGDTTRVLTGRQPATFTVTGIATFATGDSKAGVSSVLFAPATAAELLADPGTVGSIAVLADEGVDQTALSKRIAAVLPDQDEAVTGAALAVENADRKNADADFFSIFTMVFAVIALLVGAFIINNTFSILVAQRTRELAVLRALGASRRQVRRSVAIESFVVGAVASGIGLGAGIGVARGLKALLSGFGLPIPPTSLQVTTSAVVTAFTIGVVVTVLSALLPARRASRVSPMAALRNTAAETPKRSVVRTVVGVVLLALGVLGVVGGILGGKVPPVMLGALATLFGVTTLGPVFVRPVIRVLGAALPRTRGMRGVLARENAVRNPKRSAATAAALMIGVSLVVTITAFVSSAKSSITGSFDKEFRGDYAVDSGAWIYGGLSPDLAKQVAATPGVETVAEKRFTQAEVDGSTTELSSWDASSVAEIFDLGVTEGSVAAVEDDGVAVGTSYAEKHDIAVGDTLPITFASGERESFTVAALFKHSDWVGSLWVDQAAFDRNLPSALDISIFVKGAGGGVQEALEKLTATYPTATVLDRDGMSAQQAAFADKALGLVYALLALAILIALFGIANTVALSVVERTREIGLLRAVGMQRSHVRGMVRWEAAMVSTFGAVMGVAVGLFLGWSLVFAVKNSGIETANFVVPWVHVAVIVAVAAAAGVIAALLPARRAARLDVLGALATT